MKQCTQNAQEKGGWKQWKQKEAYQEGELVLTKAFFITEKENETV